MDDVTRLERIYDTLAESIDKAGAKSELYLVKLALLLAAEQGDADGFARLAETALQDL
jgi:hypothetical protein